MSHHDERIIAVIGATGQQGGAAAHHLLAQGWKVRAFTRDAASPKTQALATAGAEVVTGNMEDRASLDALMQGVYGVFSVQNFWLPEVGVEGEVRQGKNVADAAKAAGVQHFVYTSVGGAERNTGIPHFESKWQVEEYVRSLGLPATILRPVAFMENYTWSRQQILEGSFAGLGLLPHTKLQVIATDDIGAFAAVAFADPETYIGKAIEIAGDELTEVEMAELFTKVIGRPVAKVQPAMPEGQEPDPEMVKMWQWFTDQGYQANIPALRQIHPELIDFETWLYRTGWGNN